MDKNYKNLVFTNHAFERIKTRAIAPDAVWQAIDHPDQRFTQGQTTTRFIKTVAGRKIHAVATYLNREHKWLVVSVWVRGEDDRQPLVWQLLTLPFKIVWWVIKKAYSSFFVNR